MEVLHTFVIEINPSLRKMETQKRIQIWNLNDGGGRERDFKGALEEPFRFSFQIDIWF